MFREYDGIIRLDVKDAAAALDQLGIESHILLDDGRQTGGLGQVVSLYAIGNGYVHDIEALKTLTKFRKPYFSRRAG